MKDLSECRVLLVDEAKANLDILVEGLKADHKLSLALNSEKALHDSAGEIDWTAPRGRVLLIHKPKQTTS